MEAQTTLAIVRPPAASYVRALTASASPPPVDLELARSQHRTFCQALADLGAEVLSLPADTAHPDSVFVQDTAVIVAGQVVIGRPAAPARRGEDAPVAGLLAHLGLPTVRIQPPGTLEGGDVLVTERGVFVGQSGRTNAEGIVQLRRVLAPLGVDVIAIPVEGMLHLLSGVTRLGEGLLLAADPLADHPAFAGFQVIRVPAEEAYAANCLAIGEGVIVPVGYPKTAAAIRAQGFTVRQVDVSEFAKRDGGVTCLALVVSRNHL